MMEPLYSWRYRWQKHEALVYEQKKSMLFLFGEHIVSKLGYCVRSPFYSFPHAYKSMQFLLISIYTRKMYIQNNMYIGMYKKNCFTLTLL